MKILNAVLVSLAIASSIGGVHADETVGEKAKATTNDAGRSIKKGAHRVQEATCAGSDKQCLAEKAKHRATAGVDYTKDKASEIKNDVDKDRK